MAVILGGFLGASRFFAIDAGLELVMGTNALTIMIGEKAADLIR